MPLDTAAAPAAAPTQPTAKQTAENLTRGIQDRANGKAPAGKGPDQPSEGADKKPAAAAPPDPNAGKRKYVVEGREVYLTPEQADAYVQKGIAFEPKISEIARMKHEMQQFENALVSNPGKVLSDIAKRRNIPITQIVENVLNSNVSDEVKHSTGKWYWENVAKREQMDPRELKILEQDEKIKSLEARDKQAADQAIAKENRDKVVKAMATVSATIQETLKDLGIKAVDSVMGIRLTKEIADVMRVSYFSGKPCTAKQAADQVKQRVLNFQSQFYDELDGEQLVNQLGKGNVEKIRKFLLKTVQEIEKGTEVTHEKGDRKPARRGERPTITPDEFRDYLDDLKRNSK